MNWWIGITCDSSNRSTPELFRLVRIRPDFRFGYAHSETLDDLFDRAVQDASQVADGRPAHDEGRVEQILHHDDLTVLVSGSGFVHGTQPLHAQVLEVEVAIVDSIDHDGDDHLHG